MDAEAITTLTGLFFDILGVGVLFYSTSTRRIETEISVAAMREFTPKEGEEWRMSISPRITRGSSRKRSGELAVIVGLRGWDWHRSSLASGYKRWPFSFE